MLLLLLLPQELLFAISCSMQLQLVLLDATQRMHSMQRCSIVSIPISYGARGGEWGPLHLSFLSGISMFVVDLMLCFCCDPCCGLVVPSLAAAHTAGNDHG